MRINAKHYFVMKIPNNREPQQIASNNSSDFEIKHFIKKTLFTYSISSLNLDWI